MTLRHATLAPFAAIFVSHAFAGTVRDDFSVPHDYKTGVSGTIWSGLLNEGSLSVANASTTQAGSLRLQTNGVTDWFGATATGPFLYLDVAGDFDAQISLPRFAQGSIGTSVGILVRAAPDADGVLGEDSLAYGITTTSIVTLPSGSTLATGSNVLRSTNDGTTSVSNDSAGNNAPYLRIQKTGDQFVFFRRQSELFAWNAFQTVTREDLGVVSSLQVGVWMGSSESGETTVDAFQVQAEAVPEPTMWFGVGLASLVLLRRRTKPRS